MLYTCPGWPERLDHDDFGQLLADREASIANLADEVSLAGEQFDDVVLAEAELAQPVLNFRSGAELLNAYRDSGFHAVQRTNLAPGLFPGLFNCLHPAHNFWSYSRRCDPISLHAFCHFIDIICSVAVPGSAGVPPASFISRTLCA